MGEDYELVEAYYKFPFSPEHRSGMATPPLHALASVPFKWEEQPGKPRPCTDIIVRPEPASRGLELPPCRAGAKMTRMPSPTTVLDGPYNLSLSRPRFSSFRMFGEKQSSFDSSSSGGGSPQSQGGYSGDGKKKVQMSRLFKSRSLRAKKGSLGFSPSPSSLDGDVSHAAPPPLWVNFLFFLLFFINRLIKVKSTRMDTYGLNCELASSLLFWKKQWLRWILSN